ncbi:MULTISPECIES: HEAT repeat domain-containing protein [Niastella]|uniref:HEAT repeat domain-containing protein n=1 Tax=Niastella soli TaxID=2821487 RepID=A0ABS3Z287_9BACT|nr:HEAT repeat domain-containing protein [Niastella soli]MBO9203516.1 HEAT repeat domain-containing protein [Niastella soli]
MSNELENYLRNNLDQLDRKKPDAAILSRILQEMETKKSNVPTGIVVSFRLLKWAAACLLVTACGLGLWYFKKGPAVKEVVQRQTPEKPALPQSEKEPEPASVIRDPVEPSAIAIVDENLAQRKKALVNKVNGKQTVLLAGLNNTASAASRINAISATSKLKRKANTIIDALVEILNKDPNTNVRLAALDGLTRFYREAYVRKKLVASLKQQHDPLVQINLINLLTRMRESDILSQLEEMVKDDNTNKAVKDVAYSGMLQLRPGINN